VKVVVVDEPPGAPVARLQAQRPLAPLQGTTQAPPPPMSVASGGVEPPPQVATFQPVMQTPPQVTKQMPNLLISFWLNLKFGGL
jgi:hypothetical protein